MTLQVKVSCFGLPKPANIDGCLCANFYMKILALSGSLRRDSLNTAVLKAVKRLAPPHISVELFVDLGNMPLFNPDLEEAGHPVVENLLAQLLAANVQLLLLARNMHMVLPVAIPTERVGEQKHNHSTTSGYNTARIDGYDRIDVRVDKRAVYKGWLLDFYVDIMNAALMSEEITPGVNIRYVLPTVGLRARF